VTYAELLQKYDLLLAVAIAARYYHREHDPKDCAVCAALEIAIVNGALEKP